MARRLAMDPLPWTDLGKLSMIDVTNAVAPDGLGITDGPPSSDMLFFYAGFGIC